MRILTNAEIIWATLAEDSILGIPVRFIHDGCAVNIITGDRNSKGCNVMYQKVYWNFPKEVAKEIALLTGTKPVFDKEDKT